MPTAVYYDTCVFLVAHNNTHSECKVCSSILPENTVPWVVCLSSEISKAEANVSELIDRSIIYWATSGVKVRDTTLAAAKVQARLWKAEKKALRQLGFEGNDFNHLMAAIELKAEVLTSTDTDFFDPKGKAARGKGTVQTLIETRLPITVKRPSALRTA